MILLCYWKRLLPTGHYIQSAIFLDLKRRLGVGCHCFGYLHPSIPGEPLIFIEVALMKNVGSNNTGIWTSVPAVSNWRKDQTNLQVILLDQEINTDDSDHLEEDEESEGEYEYEHDEDEEEPLV